jgi:uncharacterized delta-60 repeat protein
MCGLLIALAAALSLTLAVDAHAAGGDIDTTFGSGGFVEHDITQFSPFAVDANGRFVIGVRGGLYRFFPDGSLDTSFGVDGFATLPLAPLGNRFSPKILLPSPDGGILVPGWEIMTRVDASGTVVSTFGAGGVVSFIPYNLAPKAGVYLPDDGAVIVRSSCGERSQDCTVKVERFFADGSRDLSFGTGGSIDTIVDHGGARIQGPRIGRQSDGALIMAMADRLVRYFADGTPDPAFGLSGGSTELPSAIGDMAVLPDDRIVVALAESRQVARLTADGLPDATYATGGFSRAAQVYYYYNGIVQRLLVHGDGRTTVIYTENDSFSYPYRLALHDGVSYVVRFTAAGEIDPTFAPCGFAMPAGIVVDDAMLPNDDQVFLVGGFGSQLPPDRPGAYGPLAPAKLRFARLGTPAATPCFAAVPTSLRAFAKSGVHLKWKADGDVPVSAFGNPLSTSGFGVCAFPVEAPPGDLSEAAQMPGGIVFRGKPMWKATAKGYRLRRDNNDRYFASANLKAGAAGRALIDLRLSFSSPGYQLGPFTVRLDRIDGPECWEVTVDHLRGLD